MMDAFDIGSVNVKDLLKKKIGADAADRVIQSVNDGYQQGKRGKDLQQHYQDAMQQEGHDASQEPSDMLLGFILP